MGNNMSNTVGYGLMIPYTDEEYGYDEETLPEKWTDLLDEYDGDTWDLFNHLLKDYKGLSWESSYLHDYSGATVIFVEALMAEEYGLSPVRLTDKIMYEPDTLEYDKQLLEISTKIGMPLEDAADGLGIWSVVSYG